VLSADDNGFAKIIDLSSVGPRDVTEKEPWPFLKKTDFQCPCCQKFGMSDLFMCRLVSMRYVLEEPLEILRGFRCKKYEATHRISVEDSHANGEKVLLAWPKHMSNFHLSYTAAKHNLETGWPQAGLSDDEGFHRVSLFTK